MGNLQVIETTLERAGRRRRRERAVRGLWQGLLVGAGIWLLALAVYKLFPVPRWTVGAAAGVGGVAALTGLILGGWRRATLGETARWIDERRHLQERLSTALEMAKASGAETWRELLVTDAATHVKELDPRTLVQFRLTKASRWALLLLLVGTGLAFVPEYRSKVYLQKQADQQVIKEAGKQLVELTKRSIAARPPVMEPTQKAMEAVNDLGDQLTKKALTRTEALKDLAKIADKLKDDLKDLAKDPGMKKLEQNASAHNGETSPEMANLQKEIDDAKKELGTPTGTPEDMKKLEKELAKIQAAAKAAADKNGGMNQADKENMSQSMAALAKQAQELGMQLPNLDQAIQALAANQTDMVLKDLDVASNDLEKAKDLAKNMQQMQAEMSKLGKDLAEQLKNAQPEAADATLHKMMDQLKTANLAPEQMNKMMAEVAEAADPGGKYGKVGDFLKQAAQQMQAGQKSGAGQSLADASKELERLMAQMGDAKALMAEMAALDKASQSIGTGQGWGECQNPGNNSQGDKASKKGGIGRGGKPGGGVGTWADENGGWGYDGQRTQGWDNTGIPRPDLDPRGIADRGPGELNDALKPVKQKGQFTPGGQMPSITLKGVSIKGTSTVALQEAAVAAQADAQSALSQDKVPRAYQGAVRDYFDDIKK